MSLNNANTLQGFEAHDHVAYKLQTSSPAVKSLN